MPWYCLHRHSGWTEIFQIFLDILLYYILNHIFIIIKIFINPIWKLLAATPILSWVLCWYKQDLCLFFQKNSKEDLLIQNVFSCKDSVRHKIYNNSLHVTLILPIKLSCDTALFQCGAEGRSEKRRRPKRDIRGRRGCSLGLTHCTINQMQL